MGLTNVLKDGHWDRVQVYLIGNKGPNLQDTHCTGNTGKMAPKNPCQGKHREFGNFAKTQGIWFAQVVNSLILMVKDILIFGTKISGFFLEAGLVCQVSFMYVIVTNHVNWLRKNLRSDRVKAGKTENLKLQFEWVP